MKKIFDLMMNDKPVKLTQQGLDFWANSDNRDEYRKSKWFIIWVSKDEMELCSETHMIISGVIPSHVYPCTISLKIK